MADRQNRMPPNHPRPGIAHDHLDAPAHFGSKAMHRAFIADRLIDAKRAIGNPFLRIGQKPGAIFAQIPCRAMLGTAENANHGGNRSGFGVHLPVFTRTSNPFQERTMQSSGFF